MKAKKKSAAKPAYILFGGFFAVLSAIVLSYGKIVGVPWADNSGVSCTSERVVAYGYSDKRGPIAEMAAIARWQLEAEKKQPGYSSWHLAHKRSKRCQLYRDSAHIQCVVSATPCRVKDS